jgi:hypothetical protein
MNALRVGDKIENKNGTLKIVAIEHKGHLGSKFFGKFLFTLVDTKGDRYTAFGARVTYNSNINPA